MLTIENFYKSNKSYVINKKQKSKKNYERNKTREQIIVYNISG